MSTKGAKAQIGSNADPAKNVVLETLTDGTLVIRVGSLLTPGATLATISSNGVFKSVNSLTHGTLQATNTGTAVNFTGFSPYAKKISIPIAKLSTNGTANPILQLGTAAGFVTAGYDAVATLLTSGVFTSAYANGFGLTSNGQWAAADLASGTFELTLLDPATNTWNVAGSFSAPARPATMISIGTIVLGAGAGNVLTQARLTTNGGTDLFDFGSANSLVEG